MIKLHLYVLLIVSFTCCQLLVGGDLDSLEPLAKRSPPSLGVGEGRTEGFNTVPIINPEISEIHSSIKSLFDKYANKIQIISKPLQPEPRRLYKSNVFCQLCQSLLTLYLPTLDIIPNPSPQQTEYSRRNHLYIIDDDTWELIGRFYRCEHVACADSHGLAPVFFTDVQILTPTNGESQCSFQKITLSDQLIFTKASQEQPDIKTNCQYCRAPLDAIYKHGNLSESKTQHLKNHFLRGNFFFTEKEGCKLIIEGVTMLCSRTGSRAKNGRYKTKIFRTFREAFADGIFKSLVKQKCPSIIFASELGLKKEGDKWTYTIKDNIDPSSPLAQVSSPFPHPSYYKGSNNTWPSLTSGESTHSFNQASLPYVSTECPNSGISLFPNFTEQNDPDHLPSLSTTQTDLDQYLVSDEINSTHLPFPHPLSYNDSYNTWPSLTSGGFTHSFNQASSPYVSMECPNPGINYSNYVLSLGFTASEIEYLSFITL